VPSRATRTGRPASARSRFVAIDHAAHRPSIAAYSSTADGDVAERRNSFIAPITAGCAENVPTTYATRIGRSGSKRRIGAGRPHTTPIGMPPPTVLP